MLKNKRGNPDTNLNNMEIKSLGSTDFDALFEAWNQAFAEYDIQLNENQLQAMLKRRGFNAELSFAAFEGDKIIAFTCNGIGDFEGVPTAYDTGTGTLKEYRGQGLATQIFEYSIPYLAEKGVRQYLLEVLQHNTKAVSVYRNIGFEVSREFHYFIQDSDQVRNELKTPDTPYEIKLINVREYCNIIPDFWDFNPSWQNSLESIARSAGDFINLGVFSENKFVGYCVFEPASGDITQIAVDKNYRNKGFGSLLLQKMLELNKYGSVKLINTEINRDDSVKGFLEAKNIPVRGKQFEMIKQIVV